VKSGKQRRAEIRERRLERASRRILMVDDKPWQTPELGYGPMHVIAADPAKLAHNNTYGPLPSFYADRAFTCRDCGAEELWTAKQQKWWYEIAEGNINTTAVHCRACRRVRQAKRASARRVHVAGLVEKLGLALAAERLQLSVEEVEAILASNAGKPPN
jgi:hypothetical protein